MSNTERTPLLRRTSSRSSAKETSLDFSADDPANPRAWPRRRKLGNVAVIALMAVLSPLGSSMFTPSIPEIARDLHASQTAVIAATTTYVVGLGVGPLILAPLSETFGRRRLYLSCFAVFAALQIPTALSPDVVTLLIVRGFAGFFGSVGIANGGGTISDMFAAEERASVYGWYLLGPLAGPTLGPLISGILLEYLGWRWIFGLLAILCAINLLAAFFFLQETYAPALLARRKKERLQQDANAQVTYKGEDRRSLRVKLFVSAQRPLKILFTQPIVFVMALYQALLYGTMFTLYVALPMIFGQRSAGALSSFNHNTHSLPPNMYSAPESSTLAAANPKWSGYGFSPAQLGLIYLFPGAGFLIAVSLVIPRIDTVYNALTRRNHGVGRPEFRLPLANIGGVLIPASLVTFAVLLNMHAPWAAIASTLPFYGLGQQVVFNAVQNYYLDAFEQYAASAVAAGAVFRSILGGIVPLVSPQLFEQLGYGYGFGVLACLAALLAPSPLVFYRHGPWLRERFAVDL